MTLVSNTFTPKPVCMDAHGKTPSISSDVAVCNINTGCTEAKASAIARIKQKYPAAVEITNYEDADKPENTGKVVILPDGSTVQHRWCFLNGNMVHEHRTW